MHKRKAAQNKLGSTASDISAASLVDEKRISTMDTFLASLSTLQKKPKAAATHDPLPWTHGSAPAPPARRLVAPPADAALPKTSAPIFGAWPILPGAPTIPTCARAPPRKPREERPERPPRAPRPDHYGGGGSDHYGGGDGKGRGSGRGEGGRGRGGRGKGKGGGKGKGRGKGRGKGNGGGKGKGRGRGGKGGRGRGRKGHDGPRAGAAVCQALELAPTDAPRLEALVRDFCDAHRAKVEGHLEVTRAQKQLDRRAGHDPKFLEQLMLGALRRDDAMGAAIKRVQAIFSAPPTSDDGERHFSLCAGVAQMLGGVARGWRSAMAEDDRKKAAATKRAAPAPAYSDDDDDSDDDEGGAVVASHPLLGVAPPSRKRRRAAAPPPAGVSRDVAVAARAAGLDASSSSDADSSSDDSDSDDGGDDGGMPADLLAAAEAAGAY